MAERDSHLICDYCGKEIQKHESTFVEGCPYCENCDGEAEIHADYGEEDYAEEVDDEEDDDDDYVLCKKILEI